MARFVPLLWAPLWCLLAILAAPSAHAEDKSAAVTASEPVKIAPAPSQTGSVMFVFVTVEGERIELRKRRSDDGIAEYDAAPVINALRGEVTVEGTVLSVRRFQDRALMSIDMSNGEVSANEQVLGMIPEWAQRETADTWLDANAIAILTGTTVGKQGDGSITFILDDRLRPQFDLELEVDGQRIAVGDIEPRTIGPVLLLPLDTIVEALGHTLEIDPETGFITVTRIQDTARITIVPTSGVVAVNDQIVGISPNMNYAEPDSLLFPSSAVETLTGTHIRLAPGTNIVEVKLDDRLGGGALPDAYVLDQARDTPFTLETINYEVGTRGPVTVETIAHAGIYNGRGLLRTAGGLNEPSALQPSQITIDVESLRGWRASLGDATPGLREFSGLGDTRIRGARWLTQTGDGDVIAIAAGVPVSGATSVGANASVPTFAGFAAGARLIRPDKDEEIGLAASSSGDQSRVVISGQKAMRPDRKRDKAGLSDAFVSLNVGAFQGAASNALDIDLQANANYRLSERTRVRARTSYQGASFLSRAGLDTDDAQPTTGTARTNGQLSLDWRATQDWSIIKGFGASTRVNSSLSDGQSAHSVSVSAGGRLLDNGPSVSVDLAQSTASAADPENDGSTTSLGARVFKRFDWGDAQLAVQSLQTADATDTRAVATINGSPLTRLLPKQASVSISPTISAVSTQSSFSGRLGASAMADSGATFGDRFRATAQVSAAQSLDAQSSQPDVFSTVSGAYFLNRYLQLSGSLSQNLSGGSSFFLTLRGSAPFNPPRKHSLPLEGRGVLKGRAFLDRNRDGLRQDDEPGIPGLIVSLQKTRVQLAADRDGYFTIQNLKSGLYSMAIDKRTLPLGLLVPDDATMRATVADGQVTTVNIPVIASGQVRGSVFADLDLSGDPSFGDPRFEGARLRLVSLDHPNEPAIEQLAASFGQFAFENLSPGRYRLDAFVDDAAAETIIEIDEANLLQIHHVDIAGVIDASPATPEPGAGVVMAVAP